MIFNDIDLWREALKKCNLREAVMPTSRGYIVENIDAYNKIQAMLDCPEMESAHGYLYELDVEDLSEDEVQKVESLYETAVQRGVIQEMEGDEDEEGTDDESADECDIVDVGLVKTPTCPATRPCPTAPRTPPPMPAPDRPKMKMAVFTVLYSAVKNGEIKTGESYSNAIDPRSAKADVINKLTRAGYERIEILAIEAGDPDAAMYDDMYSADFGYSDDERIADFGEEILPNAFEDDDEEEAATEAEEEEEEESSDDDSGDDTEEESSDDSSEDGEDGEEEEESSDDEEEDSDEEGEEEDSEEEDSDDDLEDDDSEDGDDEELSKEEKTKFKDQYTKAFKAAMKECGFGKAFDDLTIEEKIEFFEEIQDEWDDDKPDPVKFMEPKEIEALNKEVVKKS